VVEAAKKEAEKQDETTEVKRADPPPMPPSWWVGYEGKPVAIQLREGLSYIGVSYPNDFLINENGQVMAVPILKGILQGAKRDGDDVRLIIRTQDPKHARGHVDIVIHPGDVGFATFPEMNLIDR
jgi:hypothetical protein